jgi:hypothetical protein
MIQQQAFARTKPNSDFLSFIPSLLSGWDLSFYSESEEIIHSFILSSDSSSINHNNITFVLVAAGQ